MFDKSILETVSVVKEYIENELNKSKKYEDLSKFIWQDFMIKRCTFF